MEVSLKLQVLILCIEWVVLVISRLWYWNRSPVSVKAEDDIHLLFRQLEVKHLHVFLNALLFVRLGNDSQVPLDNEPDQNLGRGFMIPCCNLFNLRILQQHRFPWLGPWTIRRAQGAVCSHGNPFRVTVLDQLLLGQVWMTFNLETEVCRE